MATELHLQSRGERKIAKLIEWGDESQHYKWMAAESVKV